MIDCAGLLNQFDLMGQFFCEIKKLSDEYIHKNFASNIEDVFWLCNVFPLSP